MALAAARSGAAFAAARGPPTAASPRSPSGSTRRPATRPSVAGAPRAALLPRTGSRPGALGGAAAARGARPSAPRAAPGSRAAPGATPSRRRVAGVAAASPPATPPSPPPSPSSSPPPPPPSALSRALKFADRNATPLGLVVAVAVGWCFPNPGAAARRAGLQPWSTALVFFLSGLLLRPEEAREAASLPAATAWGLGSTLLLSPLAAPLLSRLPVPPSALGTLAGLSLFLCMPTTLSTAVALTRAAGGASALALLLTVASTLLGVLSVPLSLPAALRAPLLRAAQLSKGTEAISSSPSSPTAAAAAAASLALPPFPRRAVARSLAMTVAVPLAVGAAVRRAAPRLAAWVEERPRLSRYVNAACLCSVPWTQVSSARLAGLEASREALLAAGLGAVLLHLALLWFNATALKVLHVSGPRVARGSRKDVGIRRAVLLCTSQKTLPIAVAVLGRLEASLGQNVAGEAALACVLAHLFQTAYDTFLTSNWIAKDRTEEERGGQVQA